MERLVGEAQELRQPGSVVLVRHLGLAPAPAAYMAKPVINAGIDLPAHLLQEGLDDRPLVLRPELTVRVSGRAYLFRRQRRTIHDHTIYRGRSFIRTVRIQNR